MPFRPFPSLFIAAASIHFAALMFASASQAAATRKNDARLLYATAAAASAPAANAHVQRACLEPRRVSYDADSPGEIRAIANPFAAPAGL